MNDINFVKYKKAYLYVFYCETLASSKDTSVYFYKNFHQVYLLFSSKFSIYNKLS